MEEVEKFLVSNGFALQGELRDHTYFREQTRTEVKIYTNEYKVTFDYLGESATMYSGEYKINIYWLIGVLTWYRLIDRKYLSGELDKIGMIDNYLLHNSEFTEEDREVIMNTLYEIKLPTDL